MSFAIWEQTELIAARARLPDGGNVGNGADDCAVIVANNIVCFRLCCLQLKSIIIKFTPPPPIPPSFGIVCGDGSTLSHMKRITFRWETAMQKVLNANLHSVPNHVFWKRCEIHIIHEVNSKQGNTIVRREREREKFQCLNGNESFDYYYS